MRPRHGQLPGSDGYGGQNRRIGASLGLVISRSCRVAIAFHRRRPTAIAIPDPIANSSLVFRICFQAGEKGVGPRSRVFQIRPSAPIRTGFAVFPILEVVVGNVVGLEHRRIPVHLKAIGYAVHQIDRRTFQGGVQHRILGRDALLGNHQQAGHHRDKHQQRPLRAGLK